MPRLVPNVGVVSMPVSLLSSTLLNSSSWSFLSCLMAFACLLISLQRSATLLASARLRTVLRRLLSWVSSSMAHRWLSSFTIMNRMACVTVLLSLASWQGV